MDYRIAIVNSSSFGRHFPEHIERLEKIGSVERVRVAGDCHGRELARALEGFNIVIASVTPFFDGEFFDNKRDLLLLSRHGIGYNNVDVDAATACGTLVTTVLPKVERDAVAEGAIATLMDCMRRVSDSRVAANEGRWAERARFLGNGLTGKTLGIIGCGNIGSRIVEILRRGFDMRVLACDPRRFELWADALGVEYADLDTVVSNCDVLTLNADLNPTSYHLIGAEFLDKVKEGVYVLDTARGDIVDQGAMIVALESGRVRAFGIDAAPVEPPAPDDPYLNNPRVVVTPHIGAYTRQALKGMGEKVVRDAELVAAGKEPTNIVVFGQPND